MMSEISEGTFADLVRSSTQEERDHDAETTSDTDWRSARLSSSDSASIGFGETIRLQQLEEEQERLNNSLFSLSSHFAQVQFRLKQIADAKGDDREALLEGLQEFAFKECADMNELKRLRSESDSGEVFEKQRERQNILLKQLREQLEDLEQIAYEKGEGDMPSIVILQKQKAVIDKLREKTELNLNLDQMSQTDIQKEVDEAIKQLVNPFKEKEQLVDQLQTQITDLERFVNFLQIENGTSVDPSVKAISSSQFNSQKPKSSFFGLVSCASPRFQKNQLKKTYKANHYGDQRAHLQLAVDATTQVLQKFTLLTIDNAPKENGKETETTQDEVFERSESEIVAVVRKRLCPSLRSLLEHGMLHETLIVRTMPGFGCFSARNANVPVSAPSTPKPLAHVWDVIAYFYESKNDKELNDAPVRKLSQSFKLDSVAGRSITSKQILLSTIENIMSTHARLRRTKDSMWKAFVSAAMNEKRLPAWIRMIFRTRHVVEHCYNTWSYVARTGCEELYTLLEDLHKFNVEMPVDLALRPFQQMKDAF